MSKKKLDISIKNITGNCDLKCSYEFKYSESNSTAKNNGTMISLTYDSVSVPQVVFNKQNYNVGNIMITAPSIHNFNGASLPGEIIISHNPVKGGNSLNVCIPFKDSSESSSASTIITDIINKVASNAPSSGNSTNLNMIFNLDDIVPRKPFFSYTQKTTDTIVFGELEAIPLSSTTILKLQKIITPYRINIPPVELFYNSNGPISGLQLGDGIYISCKPTGSSKEKTAVKYDKSPSSITAVSFSDILQSSIFQLIIFIFVGCLLFIIIFYLISIFFSYLSSEPIQLPFLQNLYK
jgi:carbonic anhydrase